MMQHKVLLVVTAAVWLFAGWACTLPAPGEHQAETLTVLAEVCNTYDSALRVLITVESQLSNSEVEQVSRLNEVVAEVCAPGEPPPADPIAAISRINDKTNELLTMSQKEGA